MQEAGVGSLVVDSAVVDRHRSIVLHSVIAVSTVIIGTRANFFTPDKSTAIYSTVCTPLIVQSSFTRLHVIHRTTAGDVQSSIVCNGVTIGVGQGDTLGDVEGDGRAAGWSRLP